MMRWKGVLVIVLILLGVVSVAGFYAYMEPQTKVGTLYLKATYDPEVENLRNISAQLHDTNGGYLPADFDEYLFSRLGEAEEGSAEYRNILGFYAQQSASSRAGSLIYEHGGKYLPSVLKYGRESKLLNEKEGYLFLAYGIAKKEEAYKPSLYSKDEIGLYFDLIEKGDLMGVGIDSP